jgi:hydrogenase maturation protease
MAETLVIGIGNRWRGDDAAGLLVAQGLAARALPGVAVVERSSVDPSLIDLWQGAGRVILVDAVVSGAALGTVHRFDLSRVTLPATLAFCSTHALDLALLIDLARVLDRLPPEVLVFGVEASNFAQGHLPSTAVMHGLTRCVEAIAAILSSTPASRQVSSSLGHVS